MPGNLPLRPVQTVTGEDVRYAMLDVVGVEDDPIQYPRGVNEVAHWLGRYRQALWVEHSTDGKHATCKLPLAHVVIPLLNMPIGGGPVSLPIAPGSYSLDGYDPDAIGYAERVDEGEATLEFASHHGGLAVCAHPRAHVVDWDGQVAKIHLQDWDPDHNGNLVRFDERVTILVYGKR